MSSSSLCLFHLVSFRFVSFQVVCLLGCVFPGCDITPRQIKTLLGILCPPVVAIIRTELGWKCFKMYDQNVTSRIVSELFVCPNIWLLSQVIDQIGSVFGLLYSSVLVTSFSLVPTYKKKWRTLDLGIVEELENIVPKNKLVSQKVFETLRNSKRWIAKCSAISLKLNDFAQKNLAVVKYIHRNKEKTEKCGFLPATHVHTRP